MPRRKQALELCEQPARGEEQPFGMRDLGRQLESCVKAWRRREERTRLGGRAERPVEVFEHARAAALPEPCAREFQQRADGGDADASEKSAVEARDLNRQRLERLAFAAREPKRCARRRRSGEVKFEAQLTQVTAEFR